MKASNTLAVVILAAAVGAVVGIAYAPEKGKDTRKKTKKAINDYAKQLKSDLESTTNTISEKASNALDTVKNKANQVKGYTSAKVDDVEDAINA